MGDTSKCRHGKLDYEECRACENALSNPKPVVYPNAGDTCLYPAITEPGMKKVRLFCTSVSWTAFLEKRVVCEFIMTPEKGDGESQKFTKEDFDFERIKVHKPRKRKGQK